MIRRSQNSVPYEFELLEEFRTNDYKNTAEVENCRRAWNRRLTTPRWPLTPSQFHPLEERVEVELTAVHRLTVYVANNGIRADDSDATLSRVARRSNRVPGMALQVLRRAQRSREKLLTKKMVDEFRFVVEEGERQICMPISRCSMYLPLCRLGVGLRRFF